MWFLTTPFLRIHAVPVFVMRTAMQERTDVTSTEQLTNTNQTIYGCMHARGIIRLHDFLAIYIENYTTKAGRSVHLLQHRLWCTLRSIIAISSFSKPLDVSLRTIILAALLGKNLSSRYTHTDLKDWLCCDWHKHHTTVRMTVDNNQK